MKGKNWYEIQVKASLDKSWGIWFEHIQITPEANGRSKISGWMDQATVYGILTRLRDLGITLTGITSIEQNDEKGDLSNESK
jgi:hypothetical protein